jgi:hypothetical protein
VDWRRRKCRDLLSVGSARDGRPGWCQSRRITGQITDGTGAVLPGVTVTATSPALQVPSVTAVSDERGDYRLSPLPIGRYTVTFELTGFQNLRREGVRLTVGFVARVDSVMNVGAVAETVTVSGASPLVDVTSTAASTELTREQLDALPTTRDGGAYTLPFQIIASANFEHRTSTPQARQVLLAGGRQIRSILVNVEPLGTFRLPDTNLLDFRGAKRLSLGGARALELRVDVFNAMNINTIRQRIVQSGATFMLPFTAGANASQSILLPRIVQAGASFNF